jgi:hypothetical protein
VPSISTPAVDIDGQNRPRHVNGPIDAGADQASA